MSDNEEDNSSDSNSERDSIEDNDFEDYDDEEVLGDDEDISDEEEDENLNANNNVPVAGEQDEAMDVDNNINMQDPRQDVEILDDDNNQHREGATETLFKGINTIGMRVPLVSHPDVTAIDHFIVTAAHTTRHNCTYESLLDSLKWLKKSFQFVNLPTTKQALWKVLGKNDENVLYRLFCSKCKDEIGERNVIRRRCTCGSCGPGQDKTFMAIYVQTLLRPQLIDFLQIPNIAEALVYRENRFRLNENAMEDIYDGEMYQNLRRNEGFLSNRYNCSMTLWTDGLKLTRSSRATTYPIIFQLNELSPRARKKHLFLGGLWVANEHPDMNRILQPIVNELRDLYNHGIPWRPNNGEEVVYSRFIVPIFTADSLAKPDVLHMKRFNGVNGCPHCFAPGQRENNTWVYPAVQHETRTDMSIRRDGLIAYREGIIVRGVKGVSALATLPLFNLVNGVVVDPAHNPFLGVAKRLVERYLSDADEEWYIGEPNQVAAIDSKLLTIRPPTRISRKPRSIKQYRMWKISEWRNWLLYYALPCLDGILPPPYFNHLAVLCESIYILNNCSITQTQFGIAENCIRRFTEEYERLYGLKNMLFNVHLLNHLVQLIN